MLRNVLITTLISISFACSADGAEHAGPACLVPGTQATTTCSTSSWPSTPPETAKAPLWADFRSLVSVEGTLLSNLFDERFDGFKFPLEMRQGEMAIQDLRTLVRTSELDDREILADSLAEFLKCARNLRKSLVRFYAGVRDTLDSILLGRGHAFRVMEGASLEPPTPWFRSFLPVSYIKVPNNGAANQVFAGLMDSLSVKLERLSLGAEAPLVDLINLDKQLAMIQETVSRKASRKIADETCILSDLWATLGEGRVSTKRIDEVCRVLESFDGTKNRALAYVTSAQRALQTAEKQIVELRRRVAMPEPDSEATLITVHASHLKDGIEDLQEMRTQVAQRRTNNGQQSSRQCG